MFWYPARVDSTRAGFRRVLNFLQDAYKTHVLIPIKGHRIISLNMYEYVKIQVQAMSTGTLRSNFSNNPYTPRREIVKFYMILELTARSS